MEKILLRKMEVEYSSPIKYYLISDERKIFMNDFLGKDISIIFTGEYECLRCGAKIKKTFGEGLCYHCYITAPEADKCIVHPEMCLAHQGISRDLEWSKTHCLRPHYVYLAKTSKIKVGVTRENQIPTRWIDQGADKAIKLAKTPYRQLAGLIEVSMKKYFSDKTSWQQMLKNISCPDNLIEAKQKAIELMPDEFKKFIVNDNEVWNLNYPIMKNPQKVKSIRLDKVPEIKGILTGIKAQYLIFDNQNVLNIRSHSGYKINLNI
jgi:hypothetical protein